MLSYFRINDPYRLLGLLVLLLILYVPLLMQTQELTIPELKSILVGEKLNEGYKLYAETVDNTAPLAAWFHEMIDSIFGRSLLARHIVAFILIFIQSAFLGIIFINKKVFSENTYIPSLLFALLCLFSFDNLALSNELIGSMFLLLALNNLFKEIEFRVQHDETIFNLGLYISLATLFSFAFIVYLIGAFLILFLFTRTSPRKFFLLLFGFTLPHLVVLSISYLNNSLSHTWDYYYLANFAFKREVWMSTKSLLVLSAIPLFYAVVALFMLNREARFSKYQSQVLQSMFLWIGFSFIYLIFARDLRPQSLILLAPGFTFLLTHFLLVIRRRKFAEMNTWILLIGIVGICYLTRFDKIRSVDYSELKVTSNKEIENKRILVLDNRISLYGNNKVATPFLNWNLTEDIFKNPGYYENVTSVYHAFKTDAPAIVIDELNLLKPFFDRMPDVKALYRREGNTYIKKN